MNKDTAKGGKCGAFRYYTEHPKNERTALRELAKVLIAADHSPDLKVLIFEKNGSYLRASWLGDLAREQTEGEKATWDKIFNCVPTDAAGRLLRPHEIVVGHATAAPAPAYPPMIRRARPTATPATEAP